MNNWSSDVGNILYGVGGQNGIGDDIAAVLNASNRVPQNVTYVSAPVQPFNPMILVIGLAVVAALFFFLRK